MGSTTEVETNKSTKVRFTKKLWGQKYFAKIGIVSPIMTIYAVWPPYAKRNMKRRAAL
jgi:hypothetical protein